MATLHFRRIERRRTARVALCVDMIVRGETQNNLSRSEWVPIPAPRLGRATWVHEVRALPKKQSVQEVELQFTTLDQHSSWAQTID